MSGPDVSVILPAFNEGPRLAVVLDKVESQLASMQARYASELLVVDDGSTDGTQDVLRRFAGTHSQRLRIARHASNRGLSEAMKTGARAATGRIVAFLDADLSYAPEIVEPLVATLERQRAAAVLASPYMRGGRVANVPFLRRAASRAANVLLGACVGFRLHTFTGMVRAYDRVALMELLDRPVRGEFNAWVVAELLRARKRVVEIPAALVWPPARTNAPPRLDFARLGARTLLVVKTMGVLRASSGP